VARPSFVISHRLQLNEASAAYGMFVNKEDNA
jgi:hypothetical protein